MRANVRSAEKMYIERGELVVPKSLRTLPTVCCRCGGAASGQPLLQTFKWHEPVYYGTLLLGVVPYIIIGALMSKHHRLEIHLCDEHRRERTQRMRAGYGVIPLVTISTCLITKPRGLGGLLFVLALFALMIAGFVVAARASNVLAVKYMDAFESRFAGASPEILSAASRGLAKVFE